MYKPVYFTTKELVHPSIYEVLGEASIGCFTQHSLIKLDNLRKEYSKQFETKHGKADGIIINNWGWGGHLYNCGLRTINSKVGAKNSWHKPRSQGNWTFDLHCGDIAMLYSIILQNHQEFGISRVENLDHTPSWIHTEFGGGSSSLHIFNP